MRNYRVAVGVPTGVTEVGEACRRRGGTPDGSNRGIYPGGTYGGCHRAGLPVDGTTGRMIADIGGGTTDVR